MKFSNCFTAMGVHNTLRNPYQNRITAYSALCWLSLKDSPFQWARSWQSDEWQWLWLWSYHQQVILGAFFHDIGHIVGELEGAKQMMLEGKNYGTSNHAALGAEYLKKRGFPPIVTEIVQFHVQAKRYLCYKDPDYYQSTCFYSQWSVFSALNFWILQSCLGPAKRLWAFKEEKWMKIKRKSLNKIVSLLRSFACDCGTKQLKRKTSQIWSHWVITGIWRCPI